MTHTRYGLLSSSHATSNFLNDFCHLNSFCWIYAHVNHDCHSRKHALSVWLFELIAVDASYILSAHVIPVPDNHLFATFLAFHIRLIVNPLLSSTVVMDPGVNRWILFMLYVITDALSEWAW